MKHLLSIDDLDRAGIEELLRPRRVASVEVTQREIPKVPALRGKTVASLFYEDSTRTRLSFETAAKRLSADTMTFTRRTSSVKKGESLRDTVQTIEAMGVDAMVVRHAAAGAPHRVADLDRRERRQRRRRPPRAPDPGAARRCSPCAATAARPRRAHVAIVGDIRHSRVARSTTKALCARSAPTSRWSAPPTLLPGVARRLAGTVSARPRRGAPRRRRRLPPADPARTPGRRRCSRGCASTRRATGSRSSARRGCASDTLVMHPGPMNRGVEIAPEVAEGPASVITEQVDERRRGAHGRPVPMLLGVRSARAWPDDACVTTGRSGGRSSTRPGARRRRAGRDGRIAEVGTGLQRRRRARRVGLRRGARAGRPPRAPPGARAARRPRRSRPAHARPRSGGFTGDRRDAQHRRRARRPGGGRAVLAAGARSLCDVHSAGASRTGAPGRSSRRWASSTRSGVRIFTDDGALRGRRRGDAARARVRARRCPARSSRSTPRTPTLAGGGHMHEGEWSSRLGIPGRPAAAEEIIVGPRPARSPRSPARRSTSCTCRRRARSSSCAPRRRAGSRSRPRPRRTTSRSPTPCCAVVRPAVQGEPAAAHRRRRRRDQGRPRRRHHRRHRHRPRAASDGGQGAAVRGGAAGDARPRDRARAPSGTSSSNPGS